MYNFFFKILKKDRKGYIFIVHGHRKRKHRYNWPVYDDEREEKRTHTKKNGESDIGRISLL
jgi:hypothetical protein